MQSNIHDYTNIPINDLRDCYVHIPHYMFTRKSNHHIVYTDKHLKNGVAVSDANLDRFERVIGDIVKGGYLYGAPTSNAYKMYWKRYQNKEPLIVYVDEESYTKGFHNDVIYMSCSSITKEFFSNTIPAILEHDHQHQPCTTKDFACPACRMFGMIGEDGGNKGKLRFTDGVVTSLPEYANEITLQILGSPRISSTEFYLKKPSDRATMWNYDYYQEGNKRKEYMPTLSGRKVYWNRTYAREADQADNMNVTVTPIKKARFDFSVYFDKLTAEELHNLMFCLQLSRDANHKIGHGKPLGLGKVKININQAILKNYEKIDHLIKVNYTSVDLESTDAEIARIAQTPAARAILKYSRELSNGGGALVNYPKASKGGKTTIFDWFVANRGPIKNPSIKDTLPNIMDVNQELPVHEDNRQNSKSDHRNRRK